MKQDLNSYMMEKFDKYMTKIVVKLTIGVIDLLKINKLI